jgi:hypothetical protein
MVSTQERKRRSKLQTHLFENLQKVQRHCDFVLVRKSLGKDLLYQVGGFLSMQNYSLFEKELPYLLVNVFVSVDY